MGRSQLVRAADLVVVLLLAVSAQVQIWSQDASSWQSGPAPNAALAALGTLPLLVRRKHPLLALSVIVVSGWLQYELDAGLGQAFFAMVIALYSVGAHGSRRDATLGLGLVAAVVLATDVPRLRDGDPLDEVVPAWFVLGGLWGFGRWMQRRRHEMRQLHEHAIVLEQTRDEEARSAVAAERARIARELHDLVAHSMGVIVIQSQAAQRVLRDDPAAADRALRSIESTGRQGMAEMRRLLDVLVGTDDDVPHAPQPSLRTSSRWSSRSALPASRSSSGSRARRASSPRASTCRRTASCRRRSPTRCATPVVRTPPSACGTTATASRSRSPTTVRELATARPGARADRDA